MRIKRSLLIMLSLGILFCFGGQSFALGPGVKALETKLADLVNKERVKNGLVPLKYVADISDVARVKSQDMVKHDYFSHTSPVYGSPFKMMEAFGVSYLAAGENIAGGVRTAEAAMTSLMDCPGYKNNILNPVFTQMGIGAAILPGGTYYFTQLLVRR